MNEDQARLLGKIEATVTGTAEDVRALRNEVGTLGQRVSNIEERVTKVEVDREAMKPEYLKHVHKWNNHLQEFAAYKAVMLAEKEAAAKSQKTWLGIAGAAGGIIAALVRMVVG